MGSYAAQAARARRQAEKCKTERGRNRALNRAEELEALHRAEVAAGAAATALLARISR